MPSVKNMHIGISLYGKSGINAEDEALLVERGFHHIGTIEVPIKLDKSTQGEVRITAEWSAESR